MVIRLDERFLGDMLSLQEECLAGGDLLKPVSREEYLSAFYYTNFCYGWIAPNFDLIAFLTCTIKARSTEINFGRNRIPPDQLDSIGHINSLLIRKSERNQGVEAGLIENSLQEFFRKGCTHIFFPVSAGNHSSVGLLKSMGFESMDLIELRGEGERFFHRNLRNFKVIKNTNTVRA